MSCYQSAGLAQTRTCLLFPPKKNAEVLSQERKTISALLQKVQQNNKHCLLILQCLLFVFSHTDTPLDFTIDEILPPECEINTPVWD